jgi:hypothetical protein
MAKLIGNLPNQIPSNGDLGTLAFQDKDSVKIEGGEITADSITTATLNTTGDITFGDNDKAIFGAGSDLQIYHDGQSRVKDAGGGNLILMGDADVRITDTSGNETKASFVTDGAVNLSYNGSTKFSTTSTGIDVTGTVTADGLDINSSVVVDTTTGGTTPFFKVYRGTTNQANLVASFNNFNGSALTVHGNNDISFYEDTGTTPKFFWDASAERLGIGTSSPSAPLNVEADQNDVSTGSFTTPHLKLSASATTNTNGFTGVSYATSNLDNYGWTAGAQRTGTGGGATAFIWRHHSNSATGTERMRIDSSGAVSIGTYSATGATRGWICDPSDNANGYRTKSSVLVSTNMTHYQFANTNGVVGAIRTNGSATAYDTSSDYRLKEDWQPMSGSIDRVKALNPVNFAWKVDGSRVDGFLAHEAAEVVPEAVSGEKDAMRTEEYEVTPAVLDDEGNVVTEAVMGEREVPDYQGIDQSKLVPLLTSALQEAIAEIDSLKARVAALEN